MCTAPRTARVRASSCAAPARDRRRNPIKSGISRNVRALLGDCLRGCGQSRGRRAKPLMRCSVLDETCGKPWGKLRLLTFRRTAQVSLQGPRSFGRSTWGYSGCPIVRKAIAAAALSLATLAPAGFASAADLPVKAKAKPVADLPFFFVIDDRVTYSWMPKGTDPGMFIGQSERHDQRHDRQAGLFVHPLRRLGLRHQLLHHLDVQVGPQRSGQSLHRTGRDRPSSARGRTAPARPKSTACSARPSAGTKSSTPRPSRMGPLHNISFEVGMDANTENNFLAPAKRDVVAGLQFAFDLPYKGYFNVAPLVYWEFPTTTPSPSAARLSRPGIPGRDLQLPTATPTSSRPGRSKPTTTWISASCPRTCSTSRSAAAPAGMDRRATRTAFRSFRRRPVQHRHQDRVQQRTDPSDLRRQQGLLGSEVLALRRPLGCLPLLAEQVRPRSQRDARRLHRRGDRCRAPTPAPNRPSMPA